MATQSPDKKVQDTLARLDKTIALIQKDVGYVTRSLDEQREVFINLENTIRQNYVQQSEFKPIKTIVYGFVGLILTSVVGALIALVITG